MAGYRRQILTLCSRIDFAPKGLARVATGGAKCNPWYEVHQFDSPRRGERTVFYKCWVRSPQGRVRAPLRGEIARAWRIPRVALRCTRGYCHLPLRGEIARAQRSRRATFRLPSPYATLPRTRGNDRHLDIRSCRTRTHRSAPRTTACAACSRARGTRLVPR